MSQYHYECMECGTKNELAPAVVAFCKEVWDSCDECNTRQSIPLAGHPR